ncbi:MAG: SUMF1/EgtB/PvdO family nonheme iron enzyme [Crocinitomicaceae bacterium]
MKQILALIAIIIFPFFLSAQFSPVPESNLTLTEFSEKGEVITIQAFSISELITVREFKEYLNALRSHSEATYLRQLPKSKDISSEMIQKILNEEKYQNLPMPGVSWEIARNYCVWLSDLDRKNGKTDVFDLPLVGEVLAYEQIYKTNKSPVLAYWTKNTYDESFLEYKDKLAYQYEARESDPPSFKRKIIWNSPNCLNCNLENMQYEYQDSSSRYVGFRIVKRNKWQKNEQIILEQTRINFQTFQNNLNGIY